MNILFGSYGSVLPSIGVSSEFEPSKRDSLNIIINTGRKYSLKFIGGCCGFGFNDIKLLAELATKYTI